MLRHGALNHHRPSFYMDREPLLRLRRDTARDAYERHAVDRAQEQGHTPAYEHMASPFRASEVDPFCVG